MSPLFLRATALPSTPAAFQSGCLFIIRKEHSKPEERKDGDSPAGVAGTAITPGVLGPGDHSIFGKKSFQRPNSWCLFFLMPPRSGDPGALSGLRIGDGSIFACRGSKVQDPLACWPWAAAQSSRYTRPAPCGWSYGTDLEPLRSSLGPTAEELGIESLPRFHSSSGARSWRPTWPLGFAFRWPPWQASLYW